MGPVQKFVTWRLRRGNACFPLLSLVYNRAANGVHVEGAKELWAKLLVKHGVSDRLRGAH